MKSPFVRSPKHEHFADCVKYVLGLLLRRDHSGTFAESATDLFVPLSGRR